ncbi:unnamed protein product, partial [Ectocarpus fasciculatus]
RERADRTGTHAPTRFCLEREAKHQSSPGTQQTNNTLGSKIRKQTRRWIPFPNACDRSSTGSRASIAESGRFPEVSSEQSFTARCCLVQLQAIASDSKHSLPRRHHPRIVTGDVSVVLCLRVTGRCFRQSIFVNLRS